MCTSYKTLYIVMVLRWWNERLLSIARSLHLNVVLKSCASFYTVHPNTVSEESILASPWTSADKTYDLLAKQKFVKWYSISSYVIKVQIINLKSSYLMYCFLASTASTNLSEKSLKTWSFKMLSLLWLMLNDMC